MRHRTAAVLMLPALLVAGATPATRRAGYLVRFSVTGRGLLPNPMPDVRAGEGETWSYTSGGEVPTCRHTYLSYGVRLDGCVSASADATVTLDLTLTRTEPTHHADDLAEVTVGGTVVHTVRKVKVGEAVHVALGGAGTTAVDLIVGRP